MKLVKFNASTTGDTLQCSPSCHVTSRHIWLVDCRNSIQSHEFQGCDRNSCVADASQQLADQCSVESRQQRVIDYLAVQSNRSLPTCDFRRVGCGGSPIDDVTFDNYAKLNHAGGCCRFFDATCNCLRLASSTDHPAARGLQSSQSECCAFTDVRNTSDSASENRRAYGAVNVADWPTTVQPSPGDDYWSSKLEYAEDMPPDAAYDWSRYIWTSAVRAARMNYRGPVPLNMLRYTHPADRQTSSDDASCCNYNRQPHHQQQQQQQKSVGNAGAVRTSKLSLSVLHASQTSNLANTKRDFCCHRCGRRFASSSDFRRHLVVHTGEKRFRCPQCDARFSLKHNMVRHLRHIHKVDSTNL